MNKVILMGRLTRDPELRYTQTNNTAVASFTLAVDRKMVKQGEERQADFISCVAWAKGAEFIGKYFQKGSMIAVVGRIQTRNYDDKDGKKRYVTEVVVEDSYFTGSKQATGSAPRENPAPQGGGSDPTDGFYPIPEDDELPF